MLVAKPCAMHSHLQEHCPNRHEASVFVHHSWSAKADMMFSLGVTSVAGSAIPKNHVSNMLTSMSRCGYPLVDRIYQ
jgi:hypothetical protein